MADQSDRRKSIIIERTDWFFSGVIYYLTLLFKITNWHFYAYVLCLCFLILSFQLINLSFKNTK